MILTDEEMAKEMGLPYPPAKAELERDNYMVVTLQELAPIAKAQLKKVYEEGRRQLFRDKPLPDEVCHLTLDMWEDLFKIDRGSFAKYVEEE